MAIGVHVARSAPAREAVLEGTRALDGPLDRDAELRVSVIADDAWVLGAFQRGAGAPADAPLVRRVSGGASVRLGPGSIHLVLALAHTSALFPCDAARLTNRYVRPLLSALTKQGATAAYFGRDWVSVRHRPAGIVGFAHDAATGRAVFEAFLAVRAPFTRARASFLGKEPAPLEELLGHAVDEAALAEGLVEAYASIAGGAARVPDPSGRVVPGPGDAELRAEPAWTSTEDEAIGPVCAGPDARGVLRLGGDFMASRDAVADLEARVAALGGGATPTAVGEAVDLAFNAPHVAIEGVKNLGHVRDVVWASLSIARGT